MYKLYNKLLQILINLKSNYYKLHKNCILLLYYYYHCILYIIIRKNFYLILCVDLLVK